MGSKTVGLDTVTKLSELSVENDDEGLVTKLSELSVENDDEEKKDDDKEVADSTHLGPCLPEKEEQQEDLSEDEDEVDRKATEGIEMDILRVFDREGNKMVTHVATATRRNVRYKVFEN